MVKAPHLRVPFRVIGKSADVVEQDSPLEIGQCVAAVLRTRIGSRLEVPEFGIPDETFTQLDPSPTADIYLAAVEEWEPRAQAIGEALAQEMEKHVTIALEAEGG